FIITVGTTLYIQIKNNNTPDVSISCPPAINVSDIPQDVVCTKVPDISPVSFSSNNMLPKVVDFFNTNASLIVIFWFIIFCIKCFRVLGGLGYIYKIRNYKTTPPPLFWIERVNQLRILLQIKGNIRMLESR